MRVALRPATRADLEALGVEELPNRIKALTAFAPASGEAPERVLSVAGLVYLPDGTVWISALIAEEGRRYKIAVVRVTRAVLELARAGGIRRLYAAAEAGRDGAEELLARVGFTWDGVRWVWEAGRDVE